MVLRVSRGRVPFWRAALVVLVAGALAWAGLVAVGSRRTVQMRAAGTAAASALAGARAAGAGTWAADDLRAAEAAMAEALATDRAEVVRWWPVPDAARVQAAYAGVAASASHAARLATARQTSASQSLRATLAEARRAVHASDDLARAIHLGAERRAWLVRAHGALTEAAVFQHAGDLVTATQRARQAVELAAQVRGHAVAVAARYADLDTLARWRRWRDETFAWSRRERRTAIVVSKEARTLTVIVRGEAVRTYRVDLGFNWIADKTHAGDGATPEGRYRVVARKADGQSIYYKALLLDYPNQDDRAEFAQARRSGAVPASAGIGGLIEIHGEGGRGRDWTKGCVALTNAEMDELFRLVGVGTPVTIVGSDNHGPIAELGAEQRASEPGRRP